MNSPCGELRARDKRHYRCANEREGFFYFLFFSQVLLSQPGERYFRNGRRIFREGLFDERSFCIEIMPRLQRTGDSEWNSKKSARVISREGCWRIPFSSSLGGPSFVIWNSVRLGLTLRSFFSPSDGECFGFFEKFSGNSGSEHEWFHWF